MEDKSIRELYRKEEAERLLALRLIIRYDLARLDVPDGTPLLN